MPRKPRYHQLQGAVVYHVFNRGFSRYYLFEKDDAKNAFKDIVKRYIAEYAVTVYHWVIMSNHYHMVIELENPFEISVLFAKIGLSYTRYFHKKNKTSGYLWEGRFKTQPIEKEKYLIACGRYVERNPVKAGMVREASEYMFSSAGMYVNGIHDEITSYNPSYYELGWTDAERKKEYREWLKEFDEEEEKKFDVMNQPVGSEFFQKQLIRVKGVIAGRRRGRPIGANNVVTP